MNENVARALMADLQVFVACFNRLSATSMQIADDAVRLEFRRNLGQLMVKCDAELIKAITSKFPALDPLQP